MLFWGVILRQLIMDWGRELSFRPNAPNEWSLFICPTCFSSLYVPHKCWHYFGIWGIKFGSGKLFSFGPLQLWLLLESWANKLRWWFAYLWWAAMIFSIITPTISEFKPAQFFQRGFWQLICSAIWCLFAFYSLPRFLIRVGCRPTLALCAHSGLSIARAGRSWGFFFSIQVIAPSEAFIHYKLQQCFSSAARRSWSWKLC